MKKITTIATLALASGIVALSEKRATPRAHCLKETDKKVGKNKCYEVIDHIQFKTGEELHIDSIPRSMEKFIRVEADETDEQSKPKKATKKATKKPKKTVEKTKVPSEKEGSTDNESSPQDSEDAIKVEDQTSNTGEADANENVEES